MLDSIMHLPLPKSDMSVAEAITHAAAGHEPAAQALSEVGLSYADSRLTMRTDHPGLVAFLLMPFLDEPGAVASIPGASISIPLEVL